MSMAIPALTSLLERVETFRVGKSNLSGTYLRLQFNQSYRSGLEKLLQSVEVSLEFLQYLTDKINNDEVTKFEEENIRTTALQTEYLLDQSMSSITWSVFRREKTIASLARAAEEICSMSTLLLIRYGTKTFNYAEELSNYHPCTVFDFDTILSYYMDSLVQSSDLESITISGFKAIERRALARQIYGHSRIRDSFLRVWLIALSNDTVQDLLQRLLRSVTEFLPGKFEASSHQLTSQISNQQLCDHISKLLEGIKYLIVIDNLQCSRTWDGIKYSFPDNKVGSKILFTTSHAKERNLVDQLRYPSLMKLHPTVDEKMFNQLVFEGRSFPQDLEIIKLDILYYCKNSEAAVIIVAKYLSTIEPSMDSWLKFQRILSRIVNITPLVDPIAHIILAILEASGEIDPIDTKEEGNFFSEKFHETKINQLKTFNHLRKEEDKEKHISTVGLDDQLERLVAELIQSSPQLEILAIVGMAGIGKTTLADRIFYDQRVSYHFDIRAWVQISQVYSKRDAVLQLLRCVIQSTTTDCIFEGIDDASLEEMLYKSLKRRRYLIVMDDMWSKKAWTELWRIFPNDKMGSRVLWTSRQVIATEGLDCKLVHQMCLLSENKSWELLQKKVFGEDLCPPGLVDTGRQIAKNCKGLPLAIAVIAGVLADFNKTLENWKGVAESVSSVVLSNKNHCQSIFGLSYEHLPHYLKSCFLYMGAFPGGSEIKVWTLIRLWIAEGFIVRDREKSLEEVAEGYLNSLINRSLVLVGQRRSNDKVKTCYLHDLLLEFCIQEAQKERFMHVVKDFREVHSEGRIDKRARFSFHCQTYNDIHLTASKCLAASALFFKGCSLVVPDILLYYFDFKLLKVLDVICLQFDAFPVEQVSKLLLLRYLAFTASFEVPSIVFQLPRLETLIVNGPWFSSGKISALPSEFWISFSLRHLQLQVANHLLPEENFVQHNLTNLKTLSKLTLASCTRENFVGLCYIIELGVCESHEDMLIVGLWDIFFLNLVLLIHLETLNVSCYGRDHTRVLPMPKQNAFPQSLKKLTLWRSHLPWGAMASLGELPNLEVLKLRNYAFCGPEWKSLEGGFQRLKCLLIEETDLEVWYLQDCHFPQLQRLILKFCYKLKELPNEVGDICTLKQIELHFCSASAEQSAKEIQQEQLEECCNNIAVLIRTHRASSTAFLQETDE